MNLTKKIAFNTTYQLGGKVISTLLGLAAIAIMTRYLGAEQFGWYVTAVGFLQFVALLSDFGFTVTTAKMLSEPEYDRQKMLDTAFTWRFLTALAFQGLAPLFFLLFPYPAPVKMAVAITSLSFFAFALNQIFTAYYQTQLRMSIQVTGEILGRIFLVLGALLCAQERLGFIPIMIVVTLAAVVNSLFLWVKIGRLRFSFDKYLTRELFRKIWPTALSVIFNAFYLQGDRVILPLFVSQTTVGVYGAAYRVLDILTQVAAMVMGIMLPLLTWSWSRGLTQEFKAHLQIAFDIMAIILLPMITGTCLLSTPIMRLVAGTQFVSSGPILRYLVLSILGIFAGMIFGHTLLAINRQKQALAVYLSDALMSIVGYLIFIPKFGVWGAVGVTIFAEVYAGVGLWFLARRFSGFSPRLHNLIKIILACAAMAGVIYLLPDMNVGIAIFVGALTYTLAILGLGVISKKTWREIFARS